MLLRLPKDMLHVNLVMHMFDQFCDIYISLFIVNHLQLNLEYFPYQRIMEERNIKFVRDSRKSL